jgi:hypothetical protein
MCRCHFHSNHSSYTPGGKFIANTAGAREEIQDIHLLKIVLMNQDVEEVLFSKIGSGSGFEISWWMNTLSPEYAADYTHLLPSDRIM